MTRTRSLLNGLALVAVTAAITGTVTSQGGEDDTWTQYSMPTEHHDLLDRLWGKWVYDVTISTAPGEEPLRISLKADYNWILGGRFLIGRYDGYVDGELFKGREILGYDAFRGEYRSLWIDNNTTAFTMSTGHYDRAKNILTFEGTQDNVERNLRDQKFRTTYRFGDDDSFVMEIWRPGPDGKLARRTVVTATREGE